MYTCQIWIDRYVKKINRFGGNLDNAVALKGEKKKEKNWIFFLLKNGEGED